MKLRKIFPAAAAAALLGLSAGCGHNAVTYGDGVGFDFGMNPENFTLSFNLRYGKLLSAVLRDNAEIELNGKVGADGSSGKEGKGLVSSDGALRIRIGRQINGAAADLVKAGADADKLLEILK